MRDGDQIVRNLEAKQAAFFAACDKRGLSLSALAAALDAPISTLSGYRPTNAKPKPALLPLEMFIRIAACEVIPTDLANVLIEDSGHQLIAVDPVKTDWLRLGALTAQFSSKVCEYQATGGHIDHREDADLREEILIIVSEGNGAIGGG